MTELIQTQATNLIANSIPESGALLSVDHVLAESNFTPDQALVLHALLTDRKLRVSIYHLTKLLPELRNYADSGFLAYLERLNIAVQPYLTELGLPPDSRIYMSAGLGISWESSAAHISTPREERFDVYYREFTQTIRTEICTDIYDGGAEFAPSTPEYVVGDHRFWLQPLGFSQNPTAKSICVMRIEGDSQPYVAVLTSPKQYIALKILLENSGYIDESISSAHGGPSHIRNILNRINDAFRQQLDYDLFDSIPNISIGYALNADIAAKNNHINQWVGVSELSINNLILSLPDQRSNLQRSQPYLNDTIASCEARMMEAIDTTILVVNMAVYEKYLHQNIPGFVTHKTKPYLLFYERNIYDRGADMVQSKFVIELTEAEALMLLLFRTGNILDMDSLGLDETQRLRARERFRAFIERMQRMGFACHGFKIGRRELHFPNLIEMRES